MINNNIQEPYCSFEVSKLMKEKGFIKAGAAYTLDGQFWINSNLLNESITGKPKPVFIPCPTHALAIEWIRVNFGISIEINLSFNGNEWLWESSKFGKTINTKQTFKNLLESGSGFNSPQEATEAALLYVLKNLIP